MLLSYYKINENVRNPIIKTDGSACFDIPVSLRDGFELKTYRVGYNQQIKEDKLFLRKGVTTDDILKQPKVIDIDKGLIIKPGVVYLIPTGLIFQIPVNYHLQIYLRSSSGLKKHLCIPNSVGIIDSDYRDEVCLIISSVSNSAIKLFDGDMIAQGMLVRSEYLTLVELINAPEKIESRTGGFGSTGN